MLKKEDLQRGDILNHHKGVMQICVYDLFTDRLGREWVAYFVVQNCDETFAAFDDSFVNQGSPEDILKGNFYKANYLHFRTVEAILKKYTSEEVPLVEPKPVALPHLRQDGLIPVGEIALSQEETKELQQAKVILPKRKRK